VREKEELDYTFLHTKSNFNVTEIPIKLLFVRSFAAYFRPIHTICFLIEKAKAGSEKIEKHLLASHLRIDWPGFGRVLLTD